MGDKWIIRGRRISEDDITIINNLIKEHFHKGRKYISRRLAHHWKWYQPNEQTIRTWPAGTYYSLWKKKD